jgi:hypothetical protein
MVGVSDRVRRPVGAAIDAVAASWTIRSEEDGLRCTWPLARMSHLDQRAFGARPGVRPGGPSKPEPGALTPGQRRRLVRTTA